MVNEIIQKENNFKKFLEIMLKKKFRLREREVKRVLQKWEPFFSYDVVLNTKKNNFNYNRFAIVISSKSVYSNVERNFFRRRFYDFISKSEIQKKWNDFVFVVKTKVKLDKKNILSLKSFYKNLNFLINKI